MEKRTNQDPNSIFFSLTKIKSPKKKNLKIEFL